MRYSYTTVPAIRPHFVIRIVHDDKFIAAIEQRKFDLCVYPQGFPALEELKWIIIDELGTLILDHRPPFSSVRIKKITIVGCDDDDTSRTCERQNLDVCRYECSAMDLISYRRTDLHRWYLEIEEDASSSLSRRTQVSSWECDCDHAWNIEITVFTRSVPGDKASDKDDRDTLFWAEDFEEIDRSKGNQAEQQREHAEDNEDKWDGDTSSKNVLDKAEAARPHNGGSDVCSYSMDPDVRRCSVMCRTSKITARWRTSKNDPVTLGAME